MFKKTILRYLLLKIQINEIIVGDKLPSENQLKIRFGCNRHTASGVLKELTKKKLLEFKEGVGHFLVKTFWQSIDISEYVSYSKVKSKPFILETFPIRLLANFSFSNYEPKFTSDFYINDVHNATQYFFLDKNFSKQVLAKFNHSNIFTVLAHHGIPILNLEKQVSFIHNDKSYLNIKDDFIIVIKLTLSDENDRKIAICYNLLSNKYFMTKKETISM